MTPQALLLGIAGGIASALLFAAVLGGGALGAPLFALSPLPIAIASLGWGTLSGFIAAIVGSAFIAGFTTVPAGLVFLVVGAAPMAWYAHLAGLARPADESNPEAGLEWYPLARLFAAIVVITPITLIVVGYMTGTSVDEIANELADTLIALSEPDPAIDRAAVVESMRFYVRLMPVTGSMLWLSIVVFDLWLAARVVRTSGRLRRPWEPVYLRAGLPVAGIPALLAAVVLASMEGALGLAAGAVAGTLFMAYALQGFAVIHVLTLNQLARPIILGTLYGATALFSLPLLPVALVGMADAVSGIRARRLAKPSGQPPAV